MVNDSLTRSSHRHERWHAYLDPQSPRPLACYDVDVTHSRRHPLEYGFSQRITTWLVDLDHMPHLSQRAARLVAFRPEDHLDDDATLPIRAKVDLLLADEGIRPPAKVFMLAQPRVYGYVFNPLSVFYCLDDNSRLTNVIAEVRNTYGGRHNYVLDAAGRPMRTDKAFYVSPFYPVDGHYEMKLPMPGERLSVSIVLKREGERPFTASMTGARREGEVRLTDALRHPLSTRAVMFGIKRHGITLYAKGLRPYPRTSEAR